MTGLNPECQQGKHPNCNEKAWDDATDSLGVCQCTCHMWPKVEQRLPRRMVWMPDHGGWVPDYSEEPA